ncbi:hypothetical protein L202_07930 [Cryptococcus amylolentus CBS 6039]|uniref:R3H-associated N-terminal domain-containing protein n=2 Tax=Cryptococcus amylolentus TaxID=104669 RepID=A0A1E3HAS2_9TREE|nr:hypothetical protein L202_07930 [Cryptococcus amylolentus CBS 6039]ODN73404.1 hypothetical protein L202_07930 [Cryptococcus amylolentus CBS 6039]ODN99177.1 hypothetical protein I350_07336 [Cryptococcus amylolentus CBS 6273]
MAQQSEPVSLRLPAILQNPTNRAARQVEAHNAQQRQKAAARKDREYKVNWTPENNGKGKRVIRRLDNAAFAENPHIVRPDRSDYAPTVPLHPRPSRPLYPPGAISRSTHIPPAALPERDPFSADARQGVFSTSLKGTRAMLRKRGKRAEGLVMKSESEIRAWLGGQWGDIKQSADRWTVVDPRFVDYTSGETSTLSSSRRQLPPQHQIVTLPDLPITDGQIPAILEVSRSPAHMSWYVPESFDRLVLHLISRYYELVSWSEDLPTRSGDHLRITHIAVPSVIRPNRQPVKGHTLATPDTSEVSGQSSSDHNSSSSSGTESSDDDTATERGDDDDEYNPEGDITATPIPEMEDLSLANNASENGLTRTLSATSSQYASSEADSDIGTLGDSLMLSRPASGQESDGSLAGGWVDLDSDSEFGDLPAIPSFKGVREAPSFRRSGVSPQTVPKDWADKPSFFEYLYGA